MADRLMSGSRASSLASILLYVSCPTSMVATVTLVAFFWVGQPWGTYSDLSYGVFAILLLPLPFALRQVLGSTESRLASLSFWVGWVSLVGLAGASFLLTTTEIGLVNPQSSGLLPGWGPVALQSGFFLLFEFWLVLLGFTLKRTGFVNARWMSLTAVTILAYPVWAIWLARQVGIGRQPASPRPTPGLVG